MSGDSQYWLTTHNPHVGSAKDDWNLYLREDDRNDEREPKPGDKVLIYEQGRGEVDGRTVYGGKLGIVAVADVKARWRTRKTDSKFVLEAVCGNHDFAGYVPLHEIGPAMHGTGKFSARALARFGIRRIDKRQFDDLYRLFKSRPHRH